MLKRFDKGLALFSWLAAAAVAVMLVAGPTVIAHDSNKAATQSVNPYGPAASTTAPDGKALFKSNCGSCHTLSAAGTNGQVGPKLDKLGKNAASVEAVMKAGPGVMPSFSGMAPAERAAIAKFVASS